MKDTIRGFLLLVILFMIMACSTMEAGQSSGDQQATKIALGVAATQNASMAETMQSSPVSVTVTPEILPSGDPIALTATALVDKIDPQAAQNMTATHQSVEQAALAATQQAADIRTATQSVEGQATAQAKTMYDYIQRLYKNDGLLSSEGLFYPADDYEASWYDKNQLTWQAADKREYNNFVIRGDLSWKSFGMGENPNMSGCGFMYGYSDTSNYHVSYLGVDGIVHTLRKRAGERIEMKGGIAPGVSASTVGSAEFAVVVEDKMMTVFVNGVQAVRFKDPYIAIGKIGPAALTGSPLGITCAVKNIAIWEIQ